MPSRKRPGRRPLRESDAREIKDRLLRHTQRWRSRNEWAKGLDLSPSTVTGWFAKTPRAPDPFHLLRMARKRRLSPNWLLLGEGPELLGPEASRAGLESELQRWIRAELESRRQALPDEIETIVPTGAELLRRILDVYDTKLEVHRKLKKVFKEPNRSVLEEMLLEAFAKFPSRLSLADAL